MKSTHQNRIVGNDLQRRLRTLTQRVSPIQQGLRPIPTTITFYLYLVTPTMAKEWLETQRTNRTVRKNRVKKLVRDIKDGSWEANPQPVMFDEEDRIIDGQHRLHAIIAADTPAEIFVAFNVPFRIQKVIDHGSKRTYADSLKMEGNKNASILAGAIKVASWLEGGSYANPTDAELDRVKEKFVNAIEWFEDRGAIKDYSSSGYIGALLWAYEKCPVQADGFDEGVRTGANLPLRAPELALSRSMVNTKGQSHPQQGTALRTLTAFNIYLDNGTTNRLVASPVGYQKLCRKLGLKSEESVLRTKFKRPSRG